MKKEIEEKIEQAGKRVHLLLYGGEREKDSQYTEWRADLESAILDWIKVWQEKAEHKTNWWERTREQRMRWLRALAGY